MPREITGGPAAPEAPPATLPADTMIPVMLPLGQWPMVVEAIRDYYPAPRGRTDDLWQRLTQQVDHQVEMALKAQREAAERAAETALQLRLSGQNPLEPPAA